MSDKERDELAAITSAALGVPAGYVLHEHKTVADAILSAGYRKPLTITEPDIARAAQAHYELDPMCLMMDPEPIPWARLGGGWKAPHYSAVKTILAAVEPTP